MFDNLTGTPQTGGTWADTDGSGVTPTGGHLGTIDFTGVTGGPYTFTYSVTACSQTVSAEVELSVVETPDAGTSASTTVCSTDAAFDMITILTGTPDAGGSWTDAGNNPVSNMFTPGTSTPGTYTYTVTATAPCTGSATSTVTVNVTTAPDAGIDGSITYCETDAASNLFAELGGTPQTGGTWSGPSALTNGDQGTFTPGTNTTGTYTYSITACGTTETADVVVSVQDLPEAGTNGNTTVCSSDPAFDMFGILTGTPDAGGSWTDPSNNPVGNMFTPGTSVPGVYTYTVNASAPCTGTATATVSIAVTTAPNAGTDGSITLCVTDAATDLFAELGGTPQTGGTWTGPTGLGNGAQGTFTPGTNTAGTYSYSVTACGTTVTADVVVTVQELPDAGANGSTTVCSSDPAFDMITILAGTPDAGGSWTDASNNPVSNTFTPGTSTPGNYTYTVNATAPCTGNATATVSISVTAAPDAGTNGALTVCITDAATDLFAELGGTPQTGGTWTGPSGLGNGAQGTFTPGTNTAGTYSYSVTACGTTVTADVVVTIVDLPETGTAIPLEVCDQNMAVNLFDALAQPYDAGGVWNDDMATGALSANIFDASMVVSGNSYNFTYSINNGHCSIVSTTVSINVTSTACCAAEAGVLTATEICPAVGVPGDVDYQMGEAMDITISNYEDYDQYSTFLLMTNSTGLIQEMLNLKDALPVGVNGNVSNNDNTSSTSLNTEVYTIDYDFWALSAGDEGLEYTMYVYNVLDNNMPSLAPTLGVNIKDIAKTDPGCYDLSSGIKVFVPSPLVVLSGEVNIGEGDGGTNVFSYNYHEIIVSGGSGPYTYKWETDGYVRHSITGVGVVDIIYADKASWYVTVYDGNGCTGTILEFTNNPDVPGGIAELLDIYDYTIAPATNGVPTGSIDISVEGGDGNYTYQWNGPNDYTATSEDIYGLAAGWYSVTVCDGGFGNPDDIQCTSGWYWVPNLLSGGNDSGGNIRGKVYNAILEIAPNPLSEQTNIQFGYSEDALVTISLFALNGQKIKDIYHGETEGGKVQKWQWNVQDLAAGVYFVSIRFGEYERLVEKVVISK